MMRGPLTYLVRRQPYLVASLAAHAALLAGLFYTGFYLPQVEAQQRRVAASGRPDSHAAMRARVSDMERIKQLMQESLGDAPPDGQPPLRFDATTAADPRDMLAQAEALAHDIDALAARAHIEPKALPAGPGVADARNGKADETPAGVAASASAAASSPPGGAAGAPASPPDPAATGAPPQAQARAPSTASASVPPPAIVPASPSSPASGAAASPSSSSPGSGSVASGSVASAPTPSPASASASSAASSAASSPASSPAMAGGAPGAGANATADASGGANTAAGAAAAGAGGSPPGDGQAVAVPATGGGGRGAGGMSAAGAAARITALEQRARDVLQQRQGQLDKAGAQATGQQGPAARIAAFFHHNLPFEGWAGRGYTFSSDDMFHRGSGQMARVDTAAMRKGAGRLLGGGGQFANRIYVNSWYLIGPFAGKHGRELFENDSFPPEQAVVLDAAYRGKDDRFLTWRYVKAAGYPLVPPDIVEDSVYYGYTEMMMDRERELTMWIGADDDVQVWLNDQLVWKGGNVNKQWYFDAVFNSGVDYSTDYNLNEGKVAVHFRKGRNKLFFKLSNGPNKGYLSMVLTPPS